MKDRYEIASDLLKALANPVRLHIMVGLLKNECNVTEIQRKLNVPQSTVSQHLRILRDKRIIEGRRRGTEVCYKIIDELAKIIARVLDREVK